MEEEEDYEVFVEAEDIFCTEVVLRVGLPDSGVAQDFNLVRDDSVVGVYCSSGNDTVIIDDGLIPDRDYEYRVDLVDGGRVRVSSESVVVHTLDTTSHEVRWSIDTLGIAGWISDAWVVDEDDIWVVGKIVVPDPDSSWNGTGYEDFNAAHWDGERWELMRFENGAPVESIWYFSDDDIWIAGIPKHWDGERWTKYHLWDMGILDSDDGGVEHIWASSPDDIYFVGRKGSIVHYDGKDFEKQESGTDIDLRGIWGLDREHIWVVGVTSDWRRGIILGKDGDRWMEIYYTEPGDGKIGRFYSVWTDNEVLLYLNGVTGRCSYNLLTGVLSPFEGSGGWMGGGIMGVSSRDIFAGSSGSEILHYNGVRWHIYSDIKGMFGDYYRANAVFVRSDVVVFGGYYYTGVNGIPIVLRGYR